MILYTAISEGFFMGRRKESKDRIRIKNLKNIQEIYLQDIQPISLKGHINLVPGFWVYCLDPYEIIQYYADEPMFEEFVLRLKEVYLEEKDSLLNGHIKIDPKTEKLFLEGNLEQLKGIYKFYQNQEGYNYSLLFKEDRLRARLPIILYHFKEASKYLVKEMRDIIPSKDISFFSTIINNMPKKLLLDYDEDENSWTIEIGNIFNRPMPLIIKAEIDKTKLAIKCEVPELEFLDETTYQIENGKVIKEREIYSKNDLLHYFKNNLEIVDQELPNKWLMQEEQKHDNWFKTPWGGYIGITEKNEVINVSTNKVKDENGLDSLREEKDIIQTIETIYITPSEDSVLIREIASKDYYKKANERYTLMRIPLDKMNRTSIGIIKNNRLLLETSFDKSGLIGAVKKKLAGKYFYHIANLESIKDTIQFIGKEEGIYDSVDLLDAKIYEKR